MSLGFVDRIGHISSSYDHVDTSCNVSSSLRMLLSIPAHYFLGFYGFSCATLVRYFSRSNLGSSGFVITVKASCQQMLSRVYMRLFPRLCL